MVDSIQKQKQRTIAYLVLCLLATLILSSIVTTPTITLAQVPTSTYTPSPYTPSITPTPSNTPTTIPTAAAAIDNRAVITVDNVSHIQKYRVWQAHYGPVSGLAFIPQTNWLISGGYEEHNEKSPQPIRLWDVQSDQIAPIENFFQGVPEGLRGNAYGLSISLDGSRIVALMNSSTVYVWDTQTGELIGRILNSFTDTSRLVADNTWLLAGGQNRFVSLWTIPPFNPLHKAGVGPMATGYVFNPQGALGNVFPIDEDVSQVDYDADTHQVFALTLTGRLVIYKFVNDRDYTIRFAPQAPASVTPPSWGFEGSHKMTLDSARHEITYTDTNRDVVVYDFVADKVVSHLSWHQPTACLDYSTDGRLLVMSDWGFDMTLHIVDTASWKSIAQIPTGQAIMACTLSWDNKWIATGDTNGQIVLWGVPNR